MYNIDRIEI